MRKHGKMWKRFFGWMICLAMVVGMLPVMEKKAQAEPVEETTAVDTVESGIKWNKEKNYYEIWNYAGLYEFAKIVNGESDKFDNNNAANAILMADIIVTNEENLNYPWNPIGNLRIQYEGIFDGDGHTITNLKVVKYLPGENKNVGFIGFVADGGIVRNVGLKDGSTEGSESVGGVVGRNQGTVTNCYNTGKVFGYSTDVGGVVGTNDAANSNGAIIEDCYNTGCVSGYADITVVGGVVGCSTAGIITNCHNTGEVKGKSFIGGVAGLVSYGTVENSYNSGDVGTGDQSFFYRRSGRSCLLWYSRK